MFQHGDRSVFSTLNLGTHLVLNQPTSRKPLTMSAVALTGNNACTYMALWRYESSLGPGRFRRGDE